MSKTVSLSTKYFTGRKNGKFFKLSKDSNGELTFNWIVLTGCNQQWKKNPDFLYIPGFNLAGLEEDIKHFFKEFCGESDILTFLKTAYKKDVIPTETNNFNFDKTDKGVIIKSEEFNFAEYFEKFSKNTKKGFGSDQIFLEKVSETYNILSKSKKETKAALASEKESEKVKKEVKTSEKKEGKTSEKKEVKTSDLSKARLGKLTDKQHLNITDCKSNFLGCKAENFDTSNGTKTKIKKTAKYVEPNFFYYMTEENTIPTGALIFCQDYYSESEEEVKERLEKL